MIADSLLAGSVPTALISKKYVDASREVRDLVSFSYSNGGASLLEFLDAQRSYRDTQLAYRNLIGSYLSAVAQLNLAVGREVAQ